MPRISEIEEPGGDPVLTQIFEREREAFGDLLNPTKIMAHCPPILRAAKLLGASIEQSGQLPKALLSLVNFRVASINGCPFWVDINSVRVMEGDGGEAKLQAAASWRESTLFSEEERLALDYAERITTTGQRVDDALFARLKTRFSEAQIVELTAAIALENFRSKFNPPLGIEAQGFCLLPEK